MKGKKAAALADTSGGIEVLNDVEVALKEKRRLFSLS